jgi:hypothetical protein
MMPGSYPLVIYRGDTHVWNFVLWGDTGRTVPIDLTDMTVAAQIRAGTGMQPATSLDLVVTLPNQILATLAPDQSRPLPSSMKWDLQLTENASGRITTILAGPVNISGDITDSDAANARRQRSAGFMTGEVA